jgi:hypothetical protein
MIRSLARLPSMLKGMLYRCPDWVPKHHALFKLAHYPTG